MKRVLVFIIGLSLFMTGCTGSGDDESIGEGQVLVEFEPSDEAFANPMKGFKRVRYIDESEFLGTYVATEYVSTVSHIIKYNDLESSAGDTVQKIKDYSNAKWGSLAARNVKVIPRVVIVNNPGEEYWPEGLGSGNAAEKWAGEAFKQRIAAFIGKLGAAWDNDPRVAAIEAGIWGYWGEHHIYPDKINGSDRIPAAVQKVMGDAFTSAFKNKKVIVRYPTEFTAYKFGYYWDSFALPEDDTGNLIIARNTWQTVMNEGEVAYDWGDLSNIGKSPDDTLGSTSHTNNIIDWVQRTHTSSLGWISNYTQSNKSLSANAARLQKALGYRFVVQSAVYTQSVNQDGKLSLEFKVKNTGSAPFYYQWPVEVSLLENKKSVWTGAINTDIRKWLPGDSVYTVSGEFTIPETVPKGTYTLALAVLDPAGNAPALRFANKNYYKGGRMPLGTIGIGRQPDTDDLGSFDSLYSDHSLSYTP